MLTALKFYNQRNTLLSIPILDTSGPYKVRDIEGLDPPKATISTSKFAEFDDESFNSARMNQRNIVIKLGIKSSAGNTITDLRQSLYKHFMPKSFVRLVIQSTDIPDVAIEGYVESCNSVLFSKDSEVQISILCAPHSYFEELTDTVVTGISVSDSSYTAITYNGTIETGFRFLIGLNSDVVASPGFSFKNEPFGKFHMDKLIPYGNYLYVSTIPGNKYAVLSPTAVTSDSYLDSIILDPSFGSNALSKLASDSQWPMIHNGLNPFSVYAGANASYEWTLFYKVKYGGL